MNTPQLLSAFDAVTASKAPRPIWVSPYTPPGDHGDHQFVLFLKPEITAVHDGVDLAAVLDLILEKLEAFGVTLHGTRVLPADYLSAHSIMDQHYGVINAISKQGESALSADAQANLKSTFAEDLKAGARVLGGHQFLAEQPEFSPLALSTLNDNIGTTKLGGGSYAMRLNVLGHRYVLLNPFHAYQLVPFTTPGRAILVLEGVSKRDWADLRGKLTGATNPAKAEAGSIRATLLKEKDRLGLKEVNQGSNGVHLSAGPLEGMVELRRFFTDHDTGHELGWEETAFGSLLADKGFSTERIKELAANPELERDGKTVSAFDLTEETNAAESVGLLS